MSGQWSGGTANRTWGHQGMRHQVAGDAERGQRLAALLADAMFWCYKCGGAHRLADMRDCNDYDHRDVR